MDKTKVEYFDARPCSIYSNSHRQFLFLPYDYTFVFSFHNSNTKVSPLETMQHLQELVKHKNKKNNKFINKKKSTTKKSCVKLFYIILA